LHYEITFLFFHCRGPKALLRLLSAQKHLLQSPPEPICVYYFMLLFFLGKTSGLGGVAGNSQMAGCTISWKWKESINQRLMHMHARVKGQSVLDQVIRS